MIIVKCDRCGKESTYNVDPDTKCPRKQCAGTMADGTRCTKKFTIHGPRVGNRAIEPEMSKMSNEMSKVGTECPSVPALNGTIPSTGGSVCSEEKAGQVQSKPAPTNDDGTGSLGHFEMSMDNSTEIVDISLEPDETRSDDSIAANDGTGSLGQFEQEQLDIEQLDISVGASQSGGQGFKPLDPKWRNKVDEFDIQIIEERCRDFDENGQPLVRLSQKQIEAKHDLPQGYVSKHEKKYKELGLEAPSITARGWVDANPDAFEWARELKHRAHAIVATMLVFKRSLPALHHYIEGSQKLPVKKKGKRDPPEQWLIRTTKYIETVVMDKIANVWARTCNPNHPEPEKFRPLASKRKIRIFLRGWGTDNDDAKQNAWQAAEIISNMFANAMGLKAVLSINDPDNYKHSIVNRTVQKLLIDDTPEEKTLHGLGDDGGDLEDEIENALSRSIPELQFAVAGAQKDSKAIMKKLDQVFAIQARRVDATVAQAKIGDDTRKQFIELRNELHDDISQLTSELRSLVDAVRQVSAPY